MLRCWALWGELLSAGINTDRGQRLAQELRPAGVAGVLGAARKGPLSSPLLALLKRQAAVQGASEAAKREEGGNTRAASGTSREWLASEPFPPGDQLPAAWGDTACPHF